MANLKFLEESYNLKKVETYSYAGKIDGYYTVASYDVNSRTLITRICAYKYDGSDELREVLPSKKFGKAKVKVEGPTVILTFPVPLSTSKMKSNFDETISLLLKELKAREFTSGSFLTGMDDGTISLVKVGPEYVFATETDQRAYDREISEFKEAIRNTSENYILGILGILIAAAIGGAVHYLFYKLGYYVFFVPVVMSSLAYWFYKKLAGKTSVVTIILMFLILVPTIFGCLFIEYTFDFIDYFKDQLQGVPFRVIMEEVWDQITEVPGVRSEFIKDFLLNGGVMAFSVIATYFGSFKNEKQFHTMSKVD